MAATKEELQIRINRFKKYRDRGQHSRLTSIECQFVHMAQGGDGTAAMEGEIRESFYPTWTDGDFKLVCEELGWDYSRS